MATSRVDRRGRTTLPRVVLEALAVDVGDELVFGVDGDRVVVARRAAPPLNDPFATFDEWAGAADREAYGAL